MNIETFAESSKDLTFTFVTFICYLSFRAFALSAIMLYIPGQEKVSFTCIINDQVCVRFLISDMHVSNQYTYKSLTRIYIYMYQIKDDMRLKKIEN